ncbi:MAG: lipoprotein [Burkholderiaceae bacterium]|nr:lipoprotein [Burkholderiaceae bacterium]
MRPRLRPPPAAPATGARRGALLAVVASLLVAGCGQRGPLYLPENAPPPRRRRANSQPAPASSPTQADPQR